MGFKGFLFLTFLAVSLRAQGKMACADTFIKKSVDLTNGTYHLVSVADTQRELLIFRPTQATSSPAPVMIYFHGTNFPVELSRPLNAAYGLAHENAYIQALTDAGFVVIAPTANRIVPFYVGPSVLAWEANVSPYSSHFKRGRDYQLTEYLLKNLEDLSDTPIDRDHIFLSGFSSGGYMASRLAQEAPIAQLIRGIVVHSASYGECSPWQCHIPAHLPAYHPPTLLVANKDDSIVPFNSVEMYQSRLRENKIPQQAVFANEGDHAWKKNHGARVVEWLNEWLRAKFKKRSSL